MDYKYIGTPKHIRIQECAKNGFVFAPSKYSRFLPSNNSLYKPLSQLCQESTKKIKFERKKLYRYSEIGDIDVSNGTIDNHIYYGIDLPSDNPKCCIKGDILISTVRTYRNGIGLVTDDCENHCCSPAILVIRDIIDDRITKEYLLAILRSDFFIEQILGFQTRGMYPRLDNDAMKKVIIPIPKNNEVIKYVSLLSKAYINKYTIIKKRHAQIIDLIENELNANQKPNQFNYHLPKCTDLIEMGRLDTNMYTTYFKKEEFKIKNYSNGYKNIEGLGFTLSRGQNLQISNIGKSIYSKEWHKGFYTLVLPMFLSKFGTVDEVKYLGNKNALKTLKRGDLIFGAEGFEKGRSIVVVKEETNTITNIHGITLKQDSHNLNRAIFVKCFMDYLRHKGLIDLFAVGGNGGSLAQRYWPLIPFPLFPENVKEKIAFLYHNNQDYDTTTFTSDNFLDKDAEYNKSSGIYELDKTAKHIKILLNNAIDSIVNEKDVEITYS